MITIIAGLEATVVKYVAEEKPVATLASVDPIIAIKEGGVHVTPVS